jgi:hypothetical protein
MRDDAAALAVRILGVDDGGDPRSGGAAARRKAKVSPRER